MKVVFVLKNSAKLPTKAMNTNDFTLSFYSSAGRKQAGNTMSKEKEEGRLLDMATLPTTFASRRNLQTFSGLAK